MAADPPEPERDPLFDDVDRWRDELDDHFDEDWADQLLIMVSAGVVAIILMLVVMMLFNGCSVDLERSPPTLPQLDPIQIQGGTMP